MLATQIQKDPKEELLNKLVLHNMREGFIYIKGVCRGKIADDEIYSLAYKTLYRNAKRYRPGLVRFIAFAKAGLRGAVSRYWTTLNTVKNCKGMVSIDAPREETQEYSPLSGTFKGPMMAAHRIEDSVEPDFAAMRFRERMGDVQFAIKRKLSEQEQMILTLVYTAGFNFQEVGNLLGVTRSAVQSTNAEALIKVRKEMSRRGLLVDEHTGS